MSDTLRAQAAPRMTAEFRRTHTADGQNVQSPVTANLNLEPQLVFTDGTTEGKADKAWKISGRTISSGGSENIDVYDGGTIDVGAGAGRDNLGQAIAFAEIVGFLIVNRDTSAGNLIVGGEGSAAAWNSPFNASDTATVGPIAPGGFLYMATKADPAFAVADTSNHLLKLAASGGNVTYDVQFIGRSA